MYREMKQALGYLRARLGCGAAPVKVGFEITHRCNLDCAYCDRHSLDKEELSTEQLIHMLDQFHDLGMRAISLDGGEPLLRSDFGQIVEHLDDLGVIIRINTNGILVPKKIEWVRRAAKIKVSLDGGEVYHDSMRGQGSYRKALRGIELAKENQVPVELTCVLHRHNLDCVPDMVRLADSLECEVVFQPVRNSLFNASQRSGESWLPDQDKLRMAFLALARMKQRGRRVANRTGSLEHFLRYPDDVDLPCAAGWVNCTVEPDGQLYHCAQAPRIPRPQCNAVRLGVAAAFANLDRRACTQCWCARVVEENLLWGLRLAELV